MKKNHVQANIEKIREFVEEQLIAITKPVGDQVDYYKIRQKFNGYIIETLIGTEFIDTVDKKTGTTKWKLKGIKPFPNREEISEIFSLITIYLKDIETFYTRNFSPDEDDMAIFSRLSANQSGGRIGCYIDDTVKITANSFVDIIQTAIACPLDSDDFRKIYKLATRLRNKNKLKYLAIISGIILVITGVTVAVIKIRGKNNVDWDSDDAIIDDIDEIDDMEVDVPTVSIENDMIPS